MKKTTALLAGLGKTVLVTSLVPVTSFAADKTAESNANISFIAGTGPVAPVDPLNPTDPLDTEDKDNPTDLPTGDTGALTLDYVSSINFGSHEVSSKSEVYSSTSKKPFIQVSDRRGTGAGWSVSATASQFTDGTNNSLRGAKITFQNGEAVTGSSTSVAPASQQKVELPTDGSTSAAVMKATANQGMGTWFNSWMATGATNEKVSIEVPGGSATVGDHQAKITWKLTDAPGV